MASKIKVDTLETANGSGTIALSNQLSGMTTASLPALGSAQMPSGSVLQVVNATYSTAVTTNNNTFISSGITASITPSSTSSKIWVHFSTPVYKSPNNAHGITTIFRGTVSGTNLGHANWGFGASYDSSTSDSTATNTGSILDSPNTTSSQTYTIGLRSNTSVAVQAQANSGTGTITLMEIQG